MLRKKLHLCFRIFENEASGYLIHYQTDCLNQHFYLCLVAKYGYSFYGRKLQPFCISFYCKSEQDLVGDKSEATENVKFFFSIFRVSSAGANLLLPLLHRNQSWGCAGQQHRLHLYQNQPLNRSPRLPQFHAT